MRAAQRQWLDAARRPAGAARRVRAAARARRRRAPRADRRDHREILRALVARAHARRRPRAAPLGNLRAGLVARGPDRCRDHRSGRAREAVLHEGLRPVRERAPVADRRRASSGAVTTPRAEIGTEEIVVPDTVEELLGTTDIRPDRPWVVLVWDDPINLMDYVTYVFQKLFGYSKAKAHKLMLQVHNEGKAVGASGNRETCENDVARLHAHGLWATMQHDK